MSYQVSVHYAKNPSWSRNIVLARTKEEANLVARRLNGFLDSYPDIYVEVEEYSQPIAPILNNALKIAAQIVEEVELLEGMVPDIDFSLSDDVDAVDDGAYHDGSDSSLAPGEPLFPERRMNLTEMMRSIPVPEHLQIPPEMQIED